MLRFIKVEDRTLKQHKSIGVFLVYIDTGCSMSISPSKSRDLADENNKILTEWKFFTFCNIFLTRSVLSQDNGPLMIAVNGCRKAKASSLLILYGNCSVSTPFCGGGGIFPSFFSKL
jgi:hypothetical protein